MTSTSNKNGETPGPAPFDKCVLENGAGGITIPVRVYPINQYRRLLPVLSLVPIHTALLVTTSRSLPGIALSTLLFLVMTLLVMLEVKVHEELVTAKRWSHLVQKCIEQCDVDDIVSTPCVIDKRSTLVPTRKKCLVQVFTYTHNGERIQTTVLQSLHQQDPQAMFIARRKEGDD